MVCPFLFPSVSFQKLKETLETRAEEKGESTSTAGLGSGNRAMTSSQNFFIASYLRAPKALQSSDGQKKAELKLVQSAVEWLCAEALSVGWEQ